MTDRRTKVVEEEEYHEFQFRGIWTPAHVCVLGATRKISFADAMLYGIINMLQKKNGCFASNNYLAKSCGVSVRRIQQQLAKLQKLGLVRQELFQNNRRKLWVIMDAAEAMDAPEQGGRGGCKNTTPPHARTLHPPMQDDYTHKRDSKSNSKSKLSDGPSDGEVGFGIVKEVETKNTTFDIDMATMLVTELHNTRKHPARETNIANANTKTWANHIRLLRTRNGVTEEDIAKVMAWYVENMGKPFVPEAYSGEAFRRKFRSIRKQALKDLKTMVVPGKAAKAVMVRLNMLLWPKGSVEAVPSAVQSIMDDFGVWRSTCATFVKKLKDTETELEAVPEKKRRYWLGLGNKLLAFIPPPDIFAEQWMERVHRRVCGWDEWSGEFRSMLFDVESKQFRGIGMGLAEEYSGMADDWERFNEAMEAECA